VAGLLHIQPKPNQDVDPAGLGADLGASSLPRPGAAGDLEYTPDQRARASSMGEELFTTV